MARKKKTLLIPHEEPQSDGGGRDMMLFHEGAHWVTAEQKKELQKKLETTPDDLKSRLLLLGYLSKRGRGSESFLNELAWLVENHPDSEAHASATRGKWRTTDRLMEFKKQWSRQVRLNPGNPKVLWNAADFLVERFENEESEINQAIKLLKRAAKLDLDNEKIPEKLEALTKQISKLSKPQSKKRKQSSTANCRHCGNDWHPRGKKN